MTDRPNPGSDEAIALGCTCPVLDNGRGKGFVLDGKRVFWKNAKCPLHGFDPRQAEEERAREEASEAYWESNTFPDPEAEGDA